MAAAASLAKDKAPAAAAFSFLLQFAQNNLNDFWRQELDSLLEILVYLRNLSRSIYMHPMYIHIHIMQKCFFRDTRTTTIKSTIVNWCCRILPSW